MGSWDSVPIFFILVHTFEELAPAGDILIHGRGKSNDRTVEWDLKLLLNMAHVTAMVKPDAKHRGGPLILTQGRAVNNQEQHNL